MKNLNKVLQNLDEALNYNDNISSFNLSTNKIQDKNNQKFFQEPQSPEEAIPFKENLLGMKEGKRNRTGLKQSVTQIVQSDNNNIKQNITQLDETNSTDQILISTFYNNKTQLTLNQNLILSNNQNLHNLKTEQSINSNNLKNEDYQQDEQFQIQANEKCIVDLTNQNQIIEDTQLKFEPLVFFSDSKQEFQFNKLQQQSPQNNILSMEDYPQSSIDLLQVRKNIGLGKKSNKSSKNPKQISLNPIQQKQLKNIYQDTYQQLNGQNGTIIPKLDYKIQNLLESQRKSHQVLPKLQKIKAKKSLAQLGLVYSQDDFGIINDQNQQASNQNPSSYGDLKARSRLGSQASKYRYPSVQQKQSNQRQKLKNMTNKILYNQGLNQYPYQLDQNRENDYEQVRMNSDEQNEYRITDLSQYTDQKNIDQMQIARPKTNTTNQNFYPSEFITTNNNFGISNFQNKKSSQQLLQGQQQDDILCGYSLSKGQFSSFGLNEYYNMKKVQVNGSEQQDKRKMLINRTQKLDMIKVNSKQIKITPKKLNIQKMIYKQNQQNAQEKQDFQHFNNILLEQQKQLRQLKNNQNSISMNKDLIEAKQILRNVIDSKKNKKRNKYIKQEQTQTSLNKSNIKSEVIKDKASMEIDNQINEIKIINQKQEQQHNRQESISEADITNKNNLNNSYSNLNQSFNVTEQKRPVTQLNQNAHKKSLGNTGFDENNNLLSEKQFGDQSTNQISTNVIDLSQIKQNRLDNFIDQYLNSQVRNPHKVSSKVKDLQPLKNIQKKLSPFKHNDNLKEGSKKHSLSPKKLSQDEILQNTYTFQNPLSKIYIQNKFNQIKSKEQNQNKINTSLSSAFSIGNISKFQRKNILKNIQNLNQSYKTSLNNINQRSLQRDNLIASKTQREQEMKQLEKQLYKDKINQKSDTAETKKDIPKKQIQQFNAIVDDSQNQLAKLSKIQTEHGQSVIGNKLSDLENAIGPKLAISQRSQTDLQIKFNDQISNKNSSTSRKSAPYRDPLIPQLKLIQKQPNQLKIDKIHKIVEIQKNIELLQQEMNSILMQSNNITIIKLYLAEGGPNKNQEQETPKFTHRSDCFHSQLIAKKISPQKEKQTIELLNEQKSVDQAFNLVHQNEDAKSIINQMKRKCDCQSVQKNMIENRMSKSPSITRSNNGGSHRVFAGDQTSLFGFENTLNQDPLFRKYRQYSPCRKCCSTVHNPIFHNFQYGLKLFPCRPNSADKKSDIKKLDWKKTQINNVVLDADFSQQIKFESIKQNNSLIVQDDQAFQNNDLHLSNKTQKIRQISQDSDIWKNSSDEFKKQSIRLIGGFTDQSTFQDDMKKIIKEVDNQQQNQKNKFSILNDKEISHYYSIMKDPTLKEQLNKNQKQNLLIKSWKTLKVLMETLIMNKEYEILYESFQRKEDMYKIRCERDKIKEPEIINNLEINIIKTLLRCKRVYDSKQEIVRILYKTQKREKLMAQFEGEFKECSDIRAKGYYYIILKLSCRIFNQIERLRVDNPLLNRPFIYNDKNLQVTLVRDCLNIRNNMIKQFRTLKDDLDRVLDKSGKIVKIKSIISFNKNFITNERAQDDSKLNLDQKRGIKLKKGRHYLKLQRGNLLSEMQDEFAESKQSTVKFQSNNEYNLI